MNASLRTPLGVFLNLFTLATLVFVLAPLVVVVALSFTDSYLVAFPPQGFTWRWYDQVLHDAGFLNALKLSAVLALGATAASLLLGIPAAVALTQGRVPFAPAITAALLSPLIFPAMIIGLSLLLLLNGVGSRQVWLNLLLGHVVITVPYVTRNVITSLQLVNRDLEDASRTLGATAWQAFRHVTLPQIVPGVAAGALFAFMISFEDYPVSMWLADADYTPTPLFLMRQMATTFDPTIPAMSTVIVVLALAVVALLERLVGIGRLAKT